MIEHKFNLGDKLKDNVTGLTGIVMVIAKYATGCLHYGIQAKIIKDNGTLPDWQWLDESRYTLVKANAVDFGLNDKKQKNKKIPSGPQPLGPQV